LRTRDEFLASASHDLKNPLASIKATAQLLRRRLERAEPLDVERLRDGLQRIDGIVTRAGGLVDELLDLTRLQMGRPLDLEHTPTDLVGLVREVIAEQEHNTDRHTLSLETNLHHLVGMWDARRLRRVLTNLVDNAIKYSPAGGRVVISVHREAEPDGAQWACAEVRDEGIGIPADELERIFERFHRASNVEGRIGGTGIGLASARHILDNHAGTLTVTSQEGVGSTFRLRLPIEVPTASAEGEGEGVLG
jgi:signal transduction histidine kinase